VLTTDPSLRIEPLDAVKKLEKDADEIKANIRRNMTRRLFMPVPRQQILELIHAQDKIANRAQDIAVLYTHRFGELPQEVVKIIHQNLECNLAIVRQARKSIHELDELVETGFRGVEADLVISMVDELDKLESASDRKQWDLFAEMKQVEGLLEPVDAMFIYRITNLMAEIGDRAHHTGRLLEQMLVR